MLGNIFESFVFGFGVTKEKSGSSAARFVTLVDEFGATITYCIFIRDHREIKSAVAVSRK